VRSVLVVLLCALLGTMLVSCSSSGGSDPGDSQPPTVASVDPPDGSTDRSLVQSVEITFSETMDASTINDTTLLLGGRASLPHVQYDASSRTATITPDTLYAPLTWHEAVITEDVTDAAGNPATCETLSFQTGPMDVDHLDDAMEPNESIATASPVGLGATRYSLTATDDDKDTYEFTLSERRKITFATLIKHAPNNPPRWPGWQLRFMRADGEYYATRGTSAEQGQTPDFSFSFSPGTYYCQIYPSYGLETDDYVLYDLDVISDEPCADDQYEDNDFEDEAAPITTGLHTGLTGCYLDEDWHSIDMTTGQTLTVTVDATIPEGSQTRRMHIYPPGGNNFYETGTDNPFTGQVTATADGTATFYVQFWEDDVDYTLEIALTD